MFLNTGSGGIDVFLSRVNIWNVNCARATTFLFDTRTDVFLWKCQSFWDRKCLDLRQTLTPNFQIHAQCFNHLSYQGQTFAVPWFWIPALYSLINGKYLSNMWFSLIFKQTTMRPCWNIFMWLCYQQSKLKVIVWFRRATTHFLEQCWPRSWQSIALIRVIIICHFTYVARTDPKVKAICEVCFMTISCISLRPPN